MQEQSANDQKSRCLLDRSRSRRTAKAMVWAVGLWTSSDGCKPILLDGKLFQVYSDRSRFNFSTILNLLLVLEVLTEYPLACINLQKIKVLLLSLLLCPV
jgi:hypothetical protein